MMNTYQMTANSFYDLKVVEWMNITYIIPCRERFFLNQTAPYEPFLFEPRGNWGIFSCQQVESEI